LLFFIDCFKNQKPNKIKNLDSRLRGNDGETQGRRSGKALNNRKTFKLPSIK